MSSKTSLFFLIIIFIIIFDISYAIAARVTSVCSNLPMAPLRKDGLAWSVIASHNSIPIYDPCSHKNRKIKLTFKESYYVAKHTNNKLLLVHINRLDEVTQHIGWADMNCFILSDKAIKSKSIHSNRETLVYRKAMIINRPESNNEYDLQKAEVFDHYNNSKKKINEVGVFEIYYIFTPKSLSNFDYELLGNVNKIYNMENPTEILGWVHKKRILYWNHRQALEINKEKQALSERKLRKQPVIVFSNQVVLNNFYNSNVDNIFNELNKLRFMKKIKAVEDLSFTKRWPQSVKRWPILNANASFDKKRGLKSYRVGVIGDIQFKKDNNSGGIEVENNEDSKKQFFRWQERVEEIYNSLNNIDILFIVDATNSIKPYFKAISKGISGAMNEIKKIFKRLEIRPNIRFAIAVYRDPNDLIPFNWLTLDNNNEMFHSSAQFASDKLSQNQPGSTQKPYTENMLGGLNEALKQAKFYAPNSYRVVFLIGDAGSSDVLNDNERTNKRTKRNFRSDAGNSTNTYISKPYFKKNNTYRDQDIFQNEKQNDKININSMRDNISVIDSIGTLLENKKAKLYPIQIKDEQRENSNLDFKFAADLFKKQCIDIKSSCKTWVSSLQEVKASKSIIAETILNQILTREKESRMAKCMINLFLQGHNKEYILKHPELCRTTASLSEFGGETFFSPSSTYGVLMMVSDMICSVTSPEYVEMHKIQAFDKGYVLYQHPELNYELVKPVVLLSIGDLQRLVGILSAASEQRRPKDLGTIWRNLFKSMIGQQNIKLENSFAGNMEIMGIPIRSDFLKLPLSHFDESTRKIPAKQLNEFYEIIRNKWEVLSDYSQEKNNFFTTRDHKYTWLSIELLP